MTKLSILMPVYNEQQWLEKIVLRVLAQEIPGIQAKELVIVDDGSVDQSRQILERLAQTFPGQLQVIFHEKNKGKGAAIRTAIQRVTGDICLIQDADLEYNPADYFLLLEPIIDGRADCVYGSRFTGTQPKRVLFFWHYVGNKMITLFCNIVTNLNLTDMETCYKAFRANLLKTIPIRSNRFGLEPEMTVKVAQRRARIYEVGINYNGRTYAEGKKITWKDGVEALWVILKFALWRDCGKDHGSAR